MFDRMSSAEMIGLGLNISVIYHVLKKEICKKNSPDSSFLSVQNVKAVYIA